MSNDEIVNTGGTFLRNHSYVQIMATGDSVDRPPADLVKSLSEYSSATLHEALGMRTTMSPSVKPIQSSSTVCGPAYTVRVPPGDNGMVHVATDHAMPGDVLIVATESQRAAIWGELATRNARQQDLRGVVTDGNVRDTGYLAEADFPVFAAATSQAGAVKETPGEMNVPVTVGGVTISPGDVVVGDQDGVTIVPQDRIKDTVEAAESIVEREERFREQIADGETLADLLELNHLTAESE